MAIMDRESTELWNPQRTQKELDKSISASPAMVFLEVTGSPILWDEFSLSDSLSTTLRQKFIALVFQ